MEQQHLSSSDTRLEKKNSEQIPNDLIIEILSRLPPKSIARCRCVSKLWGSTLGLPCFTELYLTRSSSHPKLFFSCHSHKPSALQLFSAPQQVQNPSLVTASYHKKFPFNHDVDSFDHLRGLTCLTNRRILNGRKQIVSVIYNPTTRESLNLPKVNASYNLVRSFLGYDPIDKQFKVLSMNWSHCRRRRRNFFVEHQVLTLGTTTNRWRKMECSVPHYPSGRWICIDGGLYYHASVANEISGVTTKIVRFDVRYEKFRFINPFHKYWNSILVNYKGKLGGIFADGYNEVRRESKSFELWVLEDAEKHEWSKHVYVLPCLWKNVFAGNGSLKFVGVIDGTNEIVVAPLYDRISDPFYVYYYNFEKETIRRVEIQGMDAVKSGIVDTFLDHVEDVKLLQMF